MIMVDANEYNRLKKDVEDLKGVLNQLDNTSKKEARDSDHEISTADLTPNEIKVKNYILEHQAGQPPNKQMVIDHFEGEISRPVLFNIIGNLVSYGMINDIPDPKNRQTRRLVVNNDSILLSVTQELDKFEKVFIDLSHRAQVRAKQYAESHPDSIKGDFFRFGITLYATLYQIFNHVYKTYTIRSIVTWPTKVNNPFLLEKLTTITFNRLRKIHRYLPNFSDEDTRVYTEHYISRILDGTKNLDDFVYFLKRCGLEETVEPLADAVWNVNKEIQQFAYPEPAQNRLKDFEYGRDDWRKLLQVLKKHGIKSGGEKGRKNLAFC